MSKIKYKLMNFFKENVIIKIKKHCFDTYHILFTLIKILWYKSLITIFKY